MRARGDAVSVATDDSVRVFLDKVVGGRLGPDEDVVCLERPD